MFRAAVANDPVFARAVDADDTRHALDEVAEYDTFRDGFLVLPTLQSMYVPLFLLITGSFCLLTCGCNDDKIDWLRFRGKRTPMAR